MIFLYDADGTTRADAARRQRRRTTTNQHFFGELAQRIIKTATQLGPYGRLYEIDPRLRPTGPQRARWPRRSTSSRDTSPKARGSFGSGWRYRRPAGYGARSCRPGRCEWFTKRCTTCRGGKEDAAKVYAMRMRMQETARGT